MSSGDRLRRLRQKTFSAVDQQHETIVANRIRGEYYGIFIAGPITIHGLPSNHFDSSVTVPVQS